jgi:hypothetical protein
VLWLDKEEADVMKQRIKDMETKLQARIDATILGNRETLQRISEKYQKVASMMN